MRLSFTQFFFTIGDFSIQFSIYKSLQAVAYTTYFEFGEPVAYANTYAYMLVLLERTRLYNSQNQITLQKVKNMKHLVSPCF